MGLTVGDKGFAEAVAAEQGAVDGYDETTDTETITVTVRVTGTDEDGETALAEALDYWNSRFGKGSAHFELGIE